MDVMKPTRNKSAAKAAYWVCLIVMAGTLLVGCGDRSGGGITSSSVSVGDVTGYIYTRVTARIAGASAAGHIPVSGVDVSCAGVTAATNLAGLYRLSKVPVGVQTCTATKAGFGTITFTVTVVSGITTMATPEGSTSAGVITAQQTGTLVVNSTPSGAAITIDGVDTSVVTDVTLVLSPGYHSIGVSLDGHQAPAVQSVTLLQGATATIHFAFEGSGAGSCGNSILDQGETCDQAANNTDIACTPAYGQPCDYCDTSCQLHTVPESEYCGDGLINGPEICDDAENNGQSNSCNMTCSGTVPATCGNGVVETGEQCDGSGESLTCNSDCTTAVCGDGVSNASAGETCDDSNAVTEYCAYGQTSCVVCDSSCHSVAGQITYCGDSTINGTETCDDGNSATETCSYGETNCTVCDSSCQSVAGLLTGYCGDSIINGTEICDDGNSATETCSYGETSCSVCSATCLNAAGVTSYCGDSIIDNAHGETCDQGATNGQPNQCNSTCNGTTPSVCGNSLVEAGEICDEGNLVTEPCSYSVTSCVVCDSACQSIAGATSYCGDSITDAGNGEICDDGNAAGGDGCSEVCTTETLATNAWISIPAGDFIMGCAAGDAGCGVDESPKHTVTLSEFKIQKFEVTNSQYNACVAASACTSPSNTSSQTRSPYFGNVAYDNYPVTYIDWNQASAYCAWIGGRLPTEAEWEKAARGSYPDESIYAWGSDSPTCTLAEFYNSCTGDTSQVGSHASGASPFGVMDMAGNEWEWVNDWYASDYYSTGGPAWVDPQGPGSSPNGARVMRGGCWFDAAAVMRVSKREYYYPTYTSKYNGFRCAKD